LVYAKELEGKSKLLSYRRVSELLREIKQAGFLTSKTGSSGRYGFGSQYRLTISPEMTLRPYPRLFERCKKMRDDYYNLKNNPDIKYVRDYRLKFDKYLAEKEWAERFGWD